MRFGSDNQTGAHPAIMAALQEAVSDATGSAPPAYGSDAASERVATRFCEIFQKEVAVFLVTTGTAANALALSAFAKPGGIVFCHRQAHIFNDESGAPEFLAGCRLIAVEGPKGKIDPGALREALEPFQPELLRSGRAGLEHHGQPAAVSLTQITELGAAYALAEIRTLADLAHAKGAVVHMDGARFANAVASLGAAPADLTWRAGVDVLSFGGTKNGCLAAEAVVLFDPSAAADFPFLRKRAGHLLSKSWVTAVQFEAYFNGGLWLATARHANAMAQRAAAGLRATGGLAFEPDANEVFAILSGASITRLRAEGALFHEWSVEGLKDVRVGPEERLVRLVTSFDTGAEEVDRFLGLLTDTTKEKGARQGAPGAFKG